MTQNFFFGRNNRNGCDIDTLNMIISCWNDNITYFKEMIEAVVVPELPSVVN
jgi:hypothetical protein